MERTFRGLVVSEVDGRFVKGVSTLGLDQLPQNDLLVKVAYSSINYKDALSASGNKGVTRKFPHVPGIDAVGEVVTSQSSEFPEGNQVVVTGFDLGMNTWGGFGEYVSIPSSWAIALPSGLSAKEAMSFGTAGLTAGLSIHRLLEAGAQPTDGKVVVSGATGGVGSIAVAILATLGFEVVAISGKDEKDYLLHTLGAKEIISRQEFVDTHDKKPLNSPAFAWGLDTVGGPILSGIVKSLQYGRTVTCCGMTASNDLNTSIFPFILRGVQLSGVDSVEAPMAIRKLVWEKLAKDWKPTNLENIIREITLEELPEKLEDILQGKAKGRYVLKH